MKPIDFIKDLKIKIHKAGGEKVLPLHSVLELMEHFAFEAWKNGENNGRKILSPNGELDIDGSRRDFERFLKGYVF
jgi:hypothetical protein